jgi:hypothetical protein
MGYGQLHGSASAAHFLWGERDRARDERLGNVSAKLGATEDPR